MAGDVYIYSFHDPAVLPLSIQGEVLGAIAAGKIAVVREEASGTDYISGIELERFYGGKPPVADFKF